MSKEPVENKKLIESNKYIKNRYFTQWVMNHTIYNTMLLENAVIDKPDLANHIECVVDRLYREEKDG